MKRLVDKLLKLERKHNIFNIQFKNYAIWPYYRMYFYYNVSKDLGILDNSVSGFKKDIKYIKKIFNIFNLKKLFEKKDIFVLEHSRSNKEKIDIYTYDIVNYFGENNCSFFAFSNNGIIEKKDRVIILDLIKIISKLISKIFKNLLKIDDNFLKFIEEFQNIDKFKYINQYSSYKIELKLQYYFYHFLLKIKRIKKVILVVSYYNMPLIFAAKKLGIEVIEMQHGVISKYHLGYHYPYYETDFFPDKLLTFSKFWNSSATFPKNLKIIAVGNNFLYTKKDNIKKEKKTILIVSQTTISEKLRKFILDNIKQLENYKIYFKVHPNEFNNYESKFKDLLEYKNITIITNEQTIHDLQNFCEYQIGIYSTAIYEGIERKCKTLLLNDTGIEYMEQLLNENLAILIDYNDELVENLEKVYKPKDVTFFEKFELKGKI